MLVAVTVTSIAAVTMGALYMPLLASMEPQAVVPVAQEIFHDTVAFAALFTCAENANVLPAFTVAGRARIEMLTAGGGGGGGVLLPPPHDDRAVTIASAIVSPQICRTRVFLMIAITPPLGMKHCLA
jgi:hypothetical protein